MGGTEQTAVARSSWRSRAIGHLASACCLLACAAAPAGDLTGQDAPDFVLKSVAGHNLRLSEYRGGVVLVNFWANWCGRCMEQLSDLDELQKRYAGDGLQVLAVNIDTDDRHAREAADRLGVTVLRDRDQAVARQYDLASLPLTLLVDADGKVRHVHASYRAGDAATYDAELKALLREPCNPDSTCP